MKTILTLLAVGPMMLSLGACDTGTGPKSGQPVDFRLAAAGRPATASGAVVLTSFRLVAGAAALGSGDQFGCVDCQDSGAEASDPPAIVSVPLDGSAVQVRTEQVQPGTYSMLEIEVVRPSSEVVSANPGWVSTNTIEIRGAFNGKSFNLALAIEGSFRETLPTPLVVGAGGASSTVGATITLPVLAWFSGPAGMLDPNNQADRASIEANAQKSFAPLERRSGER